jgi:ribosome maturation factor RimP
MVNLCARVGDLHLGNQQVDDLSCIQNFDFSKSSVTFAEHFSKHRKRGQVPLSFLPNMSVEHLIKEILDPLLERHSLVLVELNLPAEHRAEVYVDGAENVSVETCSALTRALREKSGEALDAWQITVSSPGLDRPFRHPVQFEKNIGKSVEVVLLEGQKLEGLLLAWDREGITLDLFAKAKAKSGAKPPLAGEQRRLGLNEVKSVKKAIYFS